VNALSFTLGGETVITEVKRELADASVSNVIEQYGAQAAEYQTTGARVGVLMVLDLAQPKTGGLPHLSELVQARRVFRLGGNDVRWLVVVVVPGRRVVPSDMKGADCTV
jgi:hypothetical protein